MNDVFFLIYAVLVMGMRSEYPDNQIRISIKFLSGSIELFALSGGFVDLIFGYDQ